MRSQTPNRRAVATLALLPLITITACGDGRITDPADGGRNDVLLELTEDPDATDDTGATEDPDLTTDEVAGDTEPDPEPGDVNDVAEDVLPPDRSDGGEGDVALLDTEEPDATADAVEEPDTLEEMDAAGDLEITEIDGTDDTGIADGDGETYGDTTATDTGGESDFEGDSALADGDSYDETDIYDEPDLTAADILAEPDTALDSDLLAEPDIHADGDIPYGPDTLDGADLLGDTDLTTEPDLYRPPAPNIVFATSERYNGDLIEEANALLDEAFEDGQAQQAADGICSWHAESSGFGGAFVAAIITESNGYLEGLSNADGPWSLIDGTPVADTADELINGELRVPIDLDEDNRSFDSFQVAWVGGAQNCNDWTEGSGAVRGRLGSTVNVYRLFSGGTSSCGLDARLFCVQVGTGAGLNEYPTLPETGRLAFVTRTSVRGDFGLASDAHSEADRICNDEADTTVYSERIFRGWISTTDSSAPNYFTANGMAGPWYRVDGFPIADTLGGLIGNGPNVHLGYDLNDTFVAVDPIGRTWTGTLAGGTTGENCTDFTVATSLTYGVNGSAGTTTGEWTEYGAPGCNNFLQLYCFED